MIKILEFINTNDSKLWKIASVLEMDKTLNRPNVINYARRIAAKNWGDEYADSIRAIILLHQDEGESGIIIIGSEGEVLNLPEQ